MIRKHREIIDSLHGWKIRSARVIFYNGSSRVIVYVRSKYVDSITKMYHRSLVLVGSPAMVVKPLPWYRGWRKGIVRKDYDR